MKGDLHDSLLLAQNPCTPLETLYALAQEFPRAFFENPLFPLLLLEDPALSNVPHKALAALAKEPFLPPNLLENLARSSEYWVQLAVAQNVNTPSAVLGELACVPHIYVTALENPSTPEPIKLLLRRAEQATRGLYQLSKEESDSLMKMGSHAKNLLAANPNTSREQLDDLAMLNDSSIQSSLAKNPNLPIERQDELAISPDPWVRSSLASNPNLSQHNAELLSKDRDDVREKLALNLRTPHEIVTRLLTDEAYRVRRAAAQHPNASTTQIDFLRRAGATADLSISKTNREGLSNEELTLLMEGGVFTQRHLASLTQAPSEMLRTLAASQDIEIRMVLASNPSTPREVLSQLAGSKNSNVQAGLIANPSTPEDILCGLVPNISWDGVRIDLAKRANITERLAEILAADTSPNVRCALAKNEYTTAAILRDLLGDQDAEVRLAASKNPSTPAGLLSIYRRAGCTEDLSERAEPDRRLSRESLLILSSCGAFAKSLVALHPNTSVELQQVLAKDDDASVRAWVARSPYTRIAILEKLSIDTSEEVRFFVSKNPRTHRSILQKMAAEPSVAVRHGVASNVITPDETLELLSRDSTDWVRYGLTKNMKLTSRQRYL